MKCVHCGKEADPKTTLEEILVYMESQMKSRLTVLMEWEARSKEPKPSERCNKMIANTQASLDKWKRWIDKIQGLVKAENFNG